MVIGRDPGQYGFEPGQAVMPEVDRVTVPASTDLRKLAASTEIPLQTLLSLNAVLMRGVTLAGRALEASVWSGSRKAFVTLLTPYLSRLSVATARPSTRSPKAARLPTSPAISESRPISPASSSSTAETSVRRRPWPLVIS